MALKLRMDGRLVGKPDARTRAYTTTYMGGRQTTYYHLDEFPRWAKRSPNPTAKVHVIRDATVYPKESDPFPGFHGRLPLVILGLGCGGILWGVEEGPQVQQGASPAGPPQFIDPPSSSEVMCLHCVWRAVRQIALADFDALLSQPGLTAFTLPALPAGRAP